MDANLAAHGDHHRLAGLCLVAFLKVSDQISRLCFDGVSKIPVYVMPVLTKMIRDGADLERLYDTLDEHDLAAGSAQARRLFS